MTRKIAISLPDTTLGKARAAVKNRGAASLSSYIGRLIEDASASETFEAFERAGLTRQGHRREKAARKAS